MRVCCNANISSLFVFFQMTPYLLMFLSRLRHFKLILATWYDISILSACNEVNGIHSPKFTILKRTMANFNFMFSWELTLLSVHP